MFPSSYGFKVMALVVLMESIWLVQNHYKHKQNLLCGTQGVGLGSSINRILDYENFLF